MKGGNHTGIRSTHPNIRVRSAERGDIRAIAALHTKSWRATYHGILKTEYLRAPVMAEHITLWTNRLENSNQLMVVLLAECNKCLLGFICAFLNADPNWGSLIENFHVDPSMKGRGIGKLLLRSMAEIISDGDRDNPVHLWVYAKNWSSRATYERLGGGAIGSEIELAPDGERIVAIRYGWTSAKKLLYRCST